MRFWLFEALQENAGGGKIELVGGADDEELVGRLAVIDMLDKFAGGIGGNGGFVAWLENEGILDIDDIRVWHDENRTARASGKSGNIREIIEEHREILSEAQK